MPGLTIDGLAFEAPVSLAYEESMVTLSTPNAAIDDRRILNRRPPVHTNLVVRRRKAREGSTIDEVAGQMRAELTKSLAGLDCLESSAFAFSDGTSGILIAYRFPAAESIVLRQYHALRLDGDRITTMTLTADDGAFPDDERDRWLACLASTRLER